MARKIMLNLLALCAVFILISPLPGVDLERMKTNVRVQERILDTIMEEDPFFIASNRTQGIYLEGLGTIFSFSAGSPGGFSSWGNAFNVVIDGNNFGYSFRNRGNRITILGDDEDTIVDNDDQDSTQTITPEDYEVEVQRLIHDLKAYLRDYGPVMSLPEDEVVLLKVDFQSQGEGFPEDQPYEISVSGRSLSRMQSGKLSEEKFMEEITVYSRDDNATTPSDITIMRNILNTAMTGSREEFYFPSSFAHGNSWETYIPGYGAVFFNDYNPLPSMIALGYSGLHDYFLLDALEDENNKKEEEDDDEEEMDYLNDLEEDLTELLATYSPTLKSLKSNEQVVVAIRLKEKYTGYDEGILILKLNQEDIQRHRDSQEKLAEMVTIIRL